jgi:serine phosphatase RsbU (regulator of sigma subunit)
MDDPRRPEPAEGITERLVEAMLRDARTAGPAELPSVIRRCAAAIGLGHAVVRLVDLQQRQLLAMGEDAPELPVDGSLAGWAYRTLSIRVEETGGDDLVTWFPLVDGSDRLGVLGLRSTSLDAVRLRRAGAFASVVAMVITSERAHSDSFTLLTRARPMELPAEMLRAFLPPRTLGNADVVSTAVLEPAYELGGDAFDHSMTLGHLHAAIFDAMGHDLASGLTTAVAMAGCRNARRNGAPLPEIVGIIDDALARWLPEQFCTGILVELDLATGVLRWCNSGHPPPLLIRDHRVLPGALERPAEPPMGLSQLAPGPRTVHEEVLLPGDRVLLHTDGVPEARMRDGTLFGMHRFTDAIIRATAGGELASEVLRRLIHQILDERGSQLRDDATILLLEWKPPSPGPKGGRGLPGSD